MTKFSSHRLAVTLAVLGLLGAACSSSARSTGSAATTAAPSATTTASGVTGSITVFAASSLTKSFNAIGAAFSVANPGAKVTFSYDASSALVQEVIQGAPADVFASADTSNMDRLTKAGLNASTPAVFATNILEIIVAKGNPKAITGVSSLASPNLKVVLCAAAVPCGKYADQALAKANVKVTPVSLEANVKAVVTKVTSGEADAGIVYATDVEAAGGAAQGVAIPADVNVVAKYPIASVKNSKSPGVDAAFIAFVTGPEGQAILAKYGFGKP